MEARATARYVRVSPQKARLVVDLIRGRKAEEALAELNNSRKAVSRIVAKLLKSALANAENSLHLDIDSLYVKRAFVDQGPTLKRMRARAMGRGVTIRKRSSHITIVLDEGRGR